MYLNCQTDFQKNLTGTSTDMTTQQMIFEETMASLFKDCSREYPGYPGIVRSLCQGTTVLSTDALMIMDFGGVAKFITRGPADRGVDLYEAKLDVEAVRNTEEFYKALRKKYNRLLSKHEELSSEVAVLEDGLRACTSLDPSIKTCGSWGALCPAS